LAQRTTKNAEGGLLTSTMGQPAFPRNMEPADAPETRQNSGRLLRRRLTGCG
jgi:hypothetical protein